MNNSVVTNVPAYGVYLVAVCVVVWQSVVCRVSRASVWVLWFSGGFVTE